MAKLITKKYKNNNKSSAAYGRWYGRFVYTETLSTEEFAQHISNPARLSTAQLSLAC